MLRGNGTHFQRLRVDPSGIPVTYEIRDSFPVNVANMRSALSHVVVRTKRKCSVLVRAAILIKSGSPAGIQYPLPCIYGVLLPYCLAASHRFFPLHVIVLHCALMCRGAYELKRYDPLSQVRRDVPNQGLNSDSCRS